MELAVIFPPHIDYDKMQQRPQRIMEQFARHGHRVYYMNLSQRRMGPEQVEPNLFVIHDQNHIYDIVAREKAEGRRKVVLWSMWTQNWQWHDRINPDLTLYDYIDDFKEWERNLPKMVERSKLLFTTADKLTNNIRQWYPSKDVTLLENACEFEHFSRVQTEVLEKPRIMPKDLPPGYPKIPVIGYIGALAKWVDWQLVNKIADQYPLVMVGPIFGVPRPSHRNIWVLGEKHYKELPNYMQYMDIMTIPFQINDITLATNPIKMWEYLAAGKPVITTMLPEARKANGLVTMCETHDDFLNAIKERLETGSSVELKASRMELALKNSWKARYELAYKKICEHLID
jgi:teichuronic acid biosynthesis glycosyltransferase TuaH